MSGSRWRGARIIAALMLLALPGRVAADPEEDVTAVVTTLASALSENNPRRFLGLLDRNMADFQQIERDVTALTSQTRISCSVDVISADGTDADRTASLDWYMALKLQEDENVLERRRTEVRIKLAHRGRKWVVTGLTPAGLFSPMRPK